MIFFAHMLISTMWFAFTPNYSSSYFVYNRSDIILNLELEDGGNEINILLNCTTIWHKYRMFEAHIWWEHRIPGSELFAAMAFSIDLWSSIIFVEQYFCCYLHGLLLYQHCGFLTSRVTNLLTKLMLYFNTWDPQVWSQDKWWPDGRLGQVFERGDLFACKIWNFCGFYQENKTMEVFFHEKKPEKWGVPSYVKIGKGMLSIGPVGYWQKGDINS